MRLYDFVVPFETLLNEDGLVVGDFRCSGVDSTGDERARQAEIVFVRQGGFEIETERGRQFVDAAQAIVLRAGECYRIRHTGPCEDRSLVISLNSATVRELCAEDRRGDDDGEITSGNSLTVPCSRALYLDQRRLAARLESGEDVLGATEATLALAERLLAISTSREEEDRQEDERVEAVKALLSKHFDTPLTLGEIGARVDLSAYRIAHLFRATTGGTIHDHRIELRMRAAVERLADGERDLTALALDLGFYDHAHFSRNFRKRFGLTPSQYRDDAARAGW